MDTAGLLDLGKQLVEIGADRGVTFRILGHLAIRDHVKERIELLELLNRVLNKSRGESSLGQA